MELDPKKLMPDRSNRRVLFAICGLIAILGTLVRTELILLPSSARPLRPPIEAKTVLTLKQLRSAQAILKKLIVDLTNASEGKTVSAQQAERAVKIYIGNINDNSVLADVALAARFKLNIYSGMPELDRIHWKALNAECVKRLKEPGSTIKKILHQLDRARPVNGKVHKYTRLEINSCYREVYTANDLFIDWLSSKANDQDVFVVSRKLTNPMVKNFKTVDSLTDLATSAHYRFGLYMIFDGTDCFYNLFSICCLQILTYPPEQALDAINYMSSIFHGAATSEFLDGCKMQLVRKNSKK